MAAAESACGEDKSCPKWVDEGEVAPGVRSVRWEVPVSHETFHRTLQPLTAARKEALIKEVGEKRLGWDVPLKQALQRADELAKLDREAYAASAAVPTCYSRACVVQLGSNSVLIYSPLPVDDELVAHIGAEVTVVVVPSMHHHLCVQRAKAAWGEKALFVAPDGFRAAHGGELASMIDVELPSAVNNHELNALLSTAGITLVRIAPVLNELVLVHEPTGTLLTADLIARRCPANYVQGDPVPAEGPAASEWWNLLLRLLQFESASNGLLPLHVFHALDTTGQHGALDAEIDKVLALSFQRLWACHVGLIQGSDAAKALLRQTWAWLKVKNLELCAP